MAAAKRPVKTNRADRRGHWTPGKRRSRMTAREREQFLAALRRHSEAESIRSTARQLKCSDRAVRRWLTGEDWPTSRAIIKRAIAL